MRTMRNLAVGLVTAALVVSSWVYTVWLLHTAMHWILGPRP